MLSPPFCPNPNCPFHVHPPSQPWWHRIGSYATRCFGAVPRFRCLSCRRSFSTQTFSTDYFAKRRIDYRRLESLLASSMSIRSLSRAFGCSCGSVLNRIDRLARQALAAHAGLRPQARRHEDVCIDGFVSFDRSQYFPNNITISITAGSRFVLGFTHASLRRSGSMRPAQRLRRDTLYRGLSFEPRSLERSFTELLDELERDRPPRPGMPLVIITDEKREYGRSFIAHRLFRSQDADRRVAHRTVNSTLPRTFGNPLFPSNYLDREIRKDLAAHHRESTCFGRSVANGLSRLACYIGWHNYAKRFLIRAPAGEDQSHAEEAGILPGKIQAARRKLFRERSFLSRTDLDETERRIWKKAFPTPGAMHPSHLPAFALA
jgi:transposase-like protein